MMKKLIIFFCGTLALTACGNGIEKKANEKLTIARAAYERGDKSTVSRFCIPKHSRPAKPVRN